MSALASARGLDDASEGGTCDVDHYRPTHVRLLFSGAAACKFAQTVKLNARGGARVSSMNEPTDVKNDPRTTWEWYVASWKAERAEEKLALFEKTLNRGCVYRDPLIVAEGWQPLLAYMTDFHRQVPGGHFVTTEFITHHGRSIARWEMREGEARKIGVGTSYAEYDEYGKLTAMNGFFEAAPGGPTAAA